MDGRKKTVKRNCVCLPLFVFAESSNLECKVVEVCSMDLVVAWIFVVVTPIT